jgi:hypothetical protein
VLVFVFVISDAVVGDRVGILVGVPVGEFVGVAVVLVIGVGTVAVAVFGLIGDPVGTVLDFVVEVAELLSVPQLPVPQYTPIPVAKQAIITAKIIASQKYMPRFGCGRGSAISASASNAKERPVTASA